MRARVAATQVGDDLRVDIRGDLVQVTDGELQDLVEAIVLDGRGGVVVDLSGVGDVDVSGIAALSNALVALLIVAPRLRLELGDHATSPIGRLAKALMVLSRQQAGGERAP